MDIWLSFGVLLIGYHLTLTDAVIKLEYTGSMTNDSLLECGTNATLVCTIPGYLLYMRWDINSTKISECSQQTCIRSAIPSNVVLSDNTSTGIFYLTMNPVLLKDQGSEFTCSDSTSSANQMMKVKVSPSNITASSIEFSENTELKVTTDCIYPSDRINFNWFSFSTNGENIRTHVDNENIISSCLSSSNCVHANQSSYISSILKLSKIPEDQKSEERLFKVDITFDGIQLRSIEIGKVLVSVDCFPCVILVAVMGTFDVVIFIVAVVTIRTWFKKQLIRNHLRTCIYIEFVISLIDSVVHAIIVTTIIDCKVVQNRRCWIWFLGFSTIVILITCVLFIIIICKLSGFKEICCGKMLCQCRRNAPLSDTTPIKEIPVRLQVTTEHVTVVWKSDNDGTDEMLLECTTVCYQENGLNQPGKQCSSTEHFKDKHRIDPGVIQTCGLPAWIEEQTTFCVVQKSERKAMCRVDFNSPSNKTKLFLYWKDKNEKILAISEESTDRLGNNTERTSSGIFIIPLETIQSINHTDIFWNIFEIISDTSVTVCYTSNKKDNAGTKTGSQLTRDLLVPQNSRIRKIIPEWIDESQLKCKNITSVKKRNVCRVNNIFKADLRTVYVFWANQGKVLAKSSVKQRV